jgi:hypothetical protein
MQNANPLIKKNKTFIFFIKFNKYINLISIIFIYAII